METKSAIFSLFYLGPIEFYHKLLLSENAIFDVGEHFVKQGYRSRASILGANGKLNLVVPVIGKGKKMAMKDIKIAYFENWQKIHWKSIESAYRRSPYFEYYEDDFAPIFNDKNPSYLIDLNLELQTTICNLIGINSDFNVSQKYIADAESDFRTISPKNKSELTYNNYIQVFSENNEFTPNLSILDLLFNEGPNSKQYLLSGVK